MAQREGAAQASLWGKSRAKMTQTRTASGKTVRHLLETMAVKTTPSLCVAPISSHAPPPHVCIFRVAIGSMFQFRVIRTGAPKGACRCLPRWRRGECCAAGVSWPISRALLGPLTSPCSHLCTGACCGLRRSCGGRVPCTCCGSGGLRSGRGTAAAERQGLQAGGRGRAKRRAVHRCCAG